MVGASWDGEGRRLTPASRKAVGGGDNGYGPLVRRHSGDRSGGPWLPGASPRCGMKPGAFGEGYRSRIGSTKSDLGFCFGIGFVMEITEQSSRKRQKLFSENTELARPVDRLSDLPDDIICRILSFFPTTNSCVRTSILAKRWRYMWAHVPNLSFYSSELDVINSVLSRHKLQHIDSFYINLCSTRNGICHKNDVDAWITTLTTARNVQKLHLFICHPDYGLKLPTCLFTCKTLVDLSLDTGGFNTTILMTWTDVVHLPALEKLHLDGVDYESDESLPHLLSGCPVLEELSIIRNGVDNMICCYISSPTLKRLYMDNDYLDEIDEAYEVKLDAPALTYLKFDECLPENIVTAGALTSLIEADVAYHSKRTPLVYFRSVLEFLCKLYNVKSLRLFTYGMEVPNSAFSDLTTKFHNLTKLKLDADWRFITKFLENADNLQELEIITCHPESNDVLKCWMEPKQVPACMVSHLQIVVIFDFGCTKEEENMVRYILRNAIVLKEMVIEYIGSGIDLNIDLKEQSEAQERISLFERGSEACELTFY